PCRSIPERSRTWSRTGSSAAAARRARRPPDVATPPSTRPSADRRGRAALRAIPSGGNYSGRAAGDLLVERVQAAVRNQHVPIGVEKVPARSGVDVAVARAGRRPILGEDRATAELQLRCIDAFAE